MSGVDDTGVPETADGSSGGPPGRGLTQREWRIVTIAAVTVVMAFALGALVFHHDGGSSLDVATRAPIESSVAGDPAVVTTTAVPTPVSPPATQLDAPVTVAVTAVPTTAAPPPATAAPPPTTTTAAPQPTTTQAPKPTTTTTTAPPQPASCTVPEGGQAQVVTQADFESRLEHAWQLCKAPSVFGTGEAGLELRADHTWSKLIATAGGFARAHGWGNEGTWESIDTSAMNGPGHWQLNLHIDGSGTVSTLPVFAQSVPKVRLNNNGVYVADYVQLPAGAVTG